MVDEDFMVDINVSLADNVAQSDARNYRRMLMPALD